MANLKSVLTRLADDAWFTVTKIVVRVSPALGGYLLDLEGPDALEEVESLESSGELSDIVTIVGVAHPPDSREWAFAFRVDETGPHVASNAPESALQQVAPRLRQATSQLQ